MRFNFDYIGRRKLFYIVSAAVLVLSIAGLLFRGLNLGIDFTGGMELTAQFSKAVPTAKLRAQLAKDGLGGSIIQTTQTKNQVLISMPSVSQAKSDQVQADIQKNVGSFTTISFDKVTGSFSSQVVRGGIIAVILASVGIILYMMIRFDLKFALAGILAVFYDAFVSMGIVSLIHFKVNAPFVAGVLTIIGYSINDRIIIFDRIRENLQRRHKEALQEVVNLSLNQTLGRSINTAAVVVLAMLSIYILGGATTKDLAGTVVIGVIFGAYSSILLASPIWFDWMARTDRRAVVAAGEAAAPVEVAPEESPAPAAKKTSPKAKKPSAKKKRQGGPGRPQRPERPQRPPRPDAE